MRVLLWAELFWPYIGGIEVLSARLLPALQARGYDVAVVTSHDQLDLPDEDRYHGIPVYRFPFRAALKNRSAERIMELLRQVASLQQMWQPNLIHLNGVGPSNLFHLPTTKPMSARVLVTLQQQVLPSQVDGNNSLLARHLRCADWVTAVSGAALSQARRARAGNHPALVAYLQQCRRTVGTPYTTACP